MGEYMGQQYAKAEAAQNTVDNAFAQSAVGQKLANAEPRMLEGIKYDQGQAADLHTQVQQLADIVDRICGMQPEPTDGQAPSAIPPANGHLSALSQLNATRGEAMRRFDRLLDRLGGAV